MKEIAIYGKGGIGKSTISANIAAALSLMEKKCCRSKMYGEMQEMKANMATKQEL